MSAKSILASINEWFGAAPVTNADLIPEPKLETYNARAEWERVAREAEAVLLANKAALAASFRKAAKDDLAAFSFTCKRYGDFLALFVTRLGAVGDWSNRSIEPVEVAHTINLSGVNQITLSAGHAPDNKGVTRYNIGAKGTMGSGNYWSSSHQEHSFLSKPLPKGEILYAEPEHVERLGYPATVTDERPDPSASNYSNFGSFQSRVDAGISTTGLPRPAEDDRIKFHGGYITLNVPFGKGEEVYAQILKAMAVSPRPVKVVKVERSK